MSVDLNKLKLPRRPRYIENVKISGVKFGVPWHTICWSDNDLILKYSSLWREYDSEIKRTEKLMDNLYGIGRKAEYMKMVEKNSHAPTSKDAELRKLRKQFRINKWEAIGEEILLVIHDKPWDWRFEGTQHFGAGWNSRPKPGDLLVYIDSNCKYKNKDCKVYDLVQNRSEAQLRILLPKSQSIIDSVIPVSFVEEK